MVRIIEFVSHFMCGNEIDPVGLNHEHIEMFRQNPIIFSLPTVGGQAGHPFMYR